MTRPDDQPFFRKGDVVRVYGTPGPRMIVAGMVDKPGGVLVKCFWFNRRNEFQGMEFAPSFLCRASAWEHREYAPDDLAIEEINGAAD